MGDNLKIMVNPAGFYERALSELDPTKTATIWRRLKRPLLSRKGRRIQVCIDLLVTSIYWSMRKVYILHYNSTLAIRTSRPERPSIGHNRQEISGHVANALEGNQPDWHWRGWPELNVWLTRYRLFSCTWMAYVLIKNVFRDELGMLIETVFHPPLPSNCYLPGRFVIADEVQRMTATIFAFFHLLWRYLEFKKYNRLDMSIVYFLFLDDRDILKYYSLISHAAPSMWQQQQQRWQPSESAVTRPLPLGSRLRPPQAPLDNRERMMHNIMSYRVDYKEGEVFRLRPNRTPEACRRLRNTLANCTLLIMPLLALNTLAVTLIVAMLAIQARHALFNYPGCNPRLEQAVASGQLNENSFYLKERVLYCLLCDAFENWILWFDSGVVCYLAPGFMFIINQDLIIYWAHLHDKIEYVHRVVLESNDIDECSQQSISELASRHERELWLDELVFDLQMQIQDMIKQIKQADCFLTDATSSFLVIWFSLFAFFIYKSVTSRDGSLPLALLLTLLVVAVVVTVIYASLLTLHSRIHRSYPLICSLMAHDRSYYKRNFISILDYFVHNRTCYTVFRLRSMTATSYLTIVGWSFSCYFLLSKT